MLMISMGKFVLVAGIVAVLLIVGLMVGSSLIAIIDHGYAGVMYNRNGSMEPGTLSPGWHVVNPLLKVTEYPISTETVFLTKAPHKGRKSDDSLWVNTKDGKTVNVDVTYAYHMDQSSLPHVFTKFRGANADSIEFGYMKNELYRVINDVTSQYSMMDLVGDKRHEINTKVFNAYRDVLAQDGIIIETCNLSRVEPDQATLQAIQSVVNAQNALRQAEVEKQQAEIAAQKAKIEAEGKAAAQRINADAQAYQNQVLQQTTTQTVVQLE